MSEAKLYKRGAIWWARIPNPAGGRRLRVSTECTDKKAAELAARELERRAVDPSYRAAHETRLSVAADRFLAECDDRDIADATRSMYAHKSRHITRGFGLLFPTEALTGETPDPRIALIDARAVSEYVALRKREGAHPHSIKKELITLRGILALARHREEYARNPDDVMPRHFSSKYVPRTGYLADDDAPVLLGALPQHRARFVAFIVATGARLSEAMRAQREDIEATRIRIRGTKTQKARRFVPITSLTASFVARVLEGAPKSGPLFDNWDKGGMHRDLKAACLRTGIARWVDAKGEVIPLTDANGRRISAKRRRLLFPGAKVVGSLSANDLRRTFATWLLQRGVDTYLISKILGHVDTKMLERVYGQLDVAGVGRLIEARLAAPIPVLQLCEPAQASAVADVHQAADPGPSP